MQRVLRISVEREPYRAHFATVEPLREIPLAEAKPFNCASGALRHPKETKGQDYTLWQIEFAAEAARGTFDVSLALLFRGVQSDVRAGENRGRRLQHDFVAIGLVTQAMKKAGDVFRAEISLPPDQAVPGGSRAPRCGRRWLTGSIGDTFAAPPCPSASS